MFVVKLVSTHIARRAEYAADRIFDLGDVRLFAIHPAQIPRSASINRLAVH
jgi:hypothetical protein